MTRSLFVGALAAACLSLAPSVHAAATASATLSGLTFELIDLAPADGVAPTLTFLDAGDAAQSQRYANASGSSRYAYDARPDVAPFADGSALAYTWTSVAYSSLSGGNSYVSDISIFGDSAFANAGAYTMLGGYDPFGGFSLSGHTRLVISADAHADSFVSNACIERCNKAEASAVLWLGWLDPAWGAQAVQSRLFSSVTAWGNDGALLNDEHDGRLSVWFDNIGDRNVLGGFQGGVFAGGSTAAAAPVAAVPEPQTYAMLLAGLVAIGGTRLSRRRRD